MCGTTSAPAAVGVAARASAARSHRGVSCSWPDGRDDRNAGGGHGADDRLVAEGEEVLEAATSASEDDDVHVRMAGELGEGGDDRARGALPLHPRLADHDLRRREAGPDRRHEVASCGGVRAGQDPDRSRNAREASLPLGREQPFGGELALELLECEQMSAEPDPLDRRRPESELRLLLVDLGATGDVDGLPFGEVELEAVEGAPRDRDVERRARLRILQASGRRWPRRRCAGAR